MGEIIPCGQLWKPFPWRQGVPGRRAWVGNLDCAQREAVNRRRRAEVQELRHRLEHWDLGGVGGAGD